MEIEYGSVYTANLDPRYGTEPGKVRPVLVIQSNLINRPGHPSTLICCLTSVVRKEAEVLRVHLKEGEAGLENDSDVMVDQVRAIDNRRFVKRLGKLSRAKLEEVREKLQAALEL